MRWGAASGNGQRSREHRGPAWRAAVHSRRWGPHFILNFGWIWIYFFIYFFIPPHFVRFELEISYSNSVQIKWIRWVFNWQICVGLRSNGSGAFDFYFLENEKAREYLLREITRHWQSVYALRVTIYLWIWPKSQTSEMNVRHNTRQLLSTTLHIWSAGEKIGWNATN